jgi:hypothetical protein
MRSSYPIKEIKNQRKANYLIKKVCSKYEYLFERKAYFRENSSYK